MSRQKLRAKAMRRAHFLHRVLFLQRRVTFTARAVRVD